MKFDLGLLTGVTPVSSTLHLQVRAVDPTGRDGSKDTQNIHLVTNSSWTETGIKYSNRPALGPVIGTIPPPTSPGDVLSIPLNLSRVTPYLGSTITLAISTCTSSPCVNTGDAINFYAREARTENPPQLGVLYYDPNLIPTPTPTYK